MSDGAYHNAEKAEKPKHRRSRVLLTKKNQSTVASASG